jgi:hypothetical protein
MWLAGGAETCRSGTLSFAATVQSIMASNGLNGVSIALSVVAVTFFIVGTIAYSDGHKNIENTAWIKLSEGNRDGYFGLRNVYFHDDIVDFSVTAKYTNEFCTEKYCDTCEKAGKAAFGLTIIATIFAAITMALSAASIASYNKGLQIANVFMAFLSAAASLIAIGLFMSWCWNALDKVFSGDDDGYYPALGDDDGNGQHLKWGSGGILTIIGMLLMWLVVIFQIAAAAVAAPAYTATNNQTEMTKA